MIGLSCLFLTILFLAAIYFKNKFVNSALSFVNGAPQGQQLMDKIPLWAKALLVKKFLEKSNTGQENEKNDTSDPDMVSVEPEYPPTRDESRTIDVEPYKRTPEIGRGHDRRQLSPPEPDTASPSPEEPPPHGNEPNIDSSVPRFPEREDSSPFTGSDMRTPINTEIDQGIEEDKHNPSNLKEDAYMGLGEVKSQDTNTHNMWENPGSQRNLRDTDTQIEQDEHPAIETGPMESHSGIETMNLLLDQNRDPEMEKARERNREKYLRLLNASSPADPEYPNEVTNTSLNDEQESLVMRYKEMEKKM